MRVLIAEDSLSSRAMLEATLSKWGLEVVAVEDGREAWRRLQEPEAPQLVVLDWIMPGMTGPELCRKLRGRKMQIPVYIILLTARSDRRDIIEGLEAGADDYVAKPYDVLELRARINVGLRMLKLQSELIRKEKLQGVLQMAGAVCHELNQPLQIVSGNAELLLMDLAQSDGNHAVLEEIKSAVGRMAELTRKIMGITRYRTKKYMDGKTRIIDIEGAAGSAEKPHNS